MNAIAKWWEKNFCYGAERLAGLLVLFIVVASIPDRTAVPFQPRYQVPRDPEAADMRAKIAPGMSQDEVEHALGDPQSFTDSTWYYRDDPADAETNWLIRVVFTPDLHVARIDSRS